MYVVLSEFFRISAHKETEIEAELLHLGHFLDHFPVGSVKLKEYDRE